MWTSGLIINEERTHSGRHCYGKTPMQTFLDQSIWLTRNGYIRQVHVKPIWIFAVSFIFITALPCMGQKLIPEDTLEAQSDTIPVAPPPKDDFFSFPMLKSPFFGMDFDFASSFDNMGAGFSQDFSTDLNIKVKDKKVIVTAQIPVSEKNNININVTKNSIVISAEMKIENTVKDDTGNIISSSIQKRQFSNSQPLPVEVKAEVAKTDYKDDGVLIVELSRILRYWR